MTAPNRNDRQCFDKRVYWSLAEAQRVGDRVARERGVNLRGYQCPNCGQWHLTKLGVPQPQPPLPGYLACETSIWSSCNNPSTTKEQRREYRAARCREIPKELRRAWPTSSAREVA